MKNLIFFILTTLVIFSLNLYPLISHIKRAPPGRTFALIHNNVQDFFFYQSLMNEGANGEWLTTDPYTTEPHQTSIIFSYFLWLGKLSKILGLPHAVIYHFFRISLGIFFLYTVYYILYTVLKVPHPRLTYLLFLFATPLINGDKPYMNWWTGMDSIRRVAYLPHHMAGSLLLVITIILLISFTRSHLAERGPTSPGYKYLLLAIMLSPILAFIHTPSLFILLLILPPAILIYLLINGTRKLELNFLISLFIYWIIGLLFMLLMLSQTNRGFPWSQYIIWEKSLQFPLMQELIGALGFLFPFALIGAISALISRKFTNILVTSWLFIPLLLIPFASKLNISNIRLIQGAPYLPMAILAMIGVTTIERFILYIISLYKNSKLGFDFCTLIFALFFMLFTIFTYPTLAWSLKDQIREYWPIFGNVYFDNRLNTAFAYINQNFPPKAKTLSTFYTGNYLPAFTNTISFIGHFGYTYNNDEKERLVRKFFENKMRDQEAKDLILNYKIDLIFQGPEEKPIYKDKLYPRLLKPVYDREEVTIYKPNF